MLGALVTASESDVRWTEIPTYARLITRDRVYTQKYDSPWRLTHIEYSESRMRGAQSGSDHVCIVRLQLLVDVVY